ncbi:hypothetical protein N7462_000181 [Penicillium macrosclerotiorum]|uniref:uncharacterized protein n=1 Tax=Penicillium macrosclerotiorum TaxID=303699 RepID=UPI0025495564|nr:uncharacterized protein N7462_000181 [Penicillium macrosclerotiorum]KAJ5698176.1 hypothetical protein N7462_000181 [Penicillium macrosclerotiorum]
MEKDRDSKIPYRQLIFDQGVVTEEIVNHQYRGTGTIEDPYLVNWIANDPRNPKEFSAFSRWAYTALMALATLEVSLASSAYTGGELEVMKEFQISSEVANLGVSVFLLGFAIGPLFWAPMSELYGRQILFFVSFSGFTILSAAIPGSKNPWSLIILRFLAACFGSSLLTNAGGVIADMFSATERCLAMSLFANAAFCGPVLGPIIGGFLGMNAGWRWVMGLLAAVSGVLFITCCLLVPETYMPILLQRRARRLSKISGKVYRSEFEVQQGKISAKIAFKTVLCRPFILLLCEPIVLLLSIYIATIYGTLYMMFGAFQIVFQDERQWNQGLSGLALLGLLVGVLCALGFTIFDNKRYTKIQEMHNGFAPPEARLLPCLIGAIVLPISLFAFAWTTFQSIHWIVGIIAIAPFGFGMVILYLSITNYLIDSYTIFAASALAANSILRSFIGAAFPLFTVTMYDNLGVHWASSVPAFLALACAPFPFLISKYGQSIRKKCKHAADSEALIRKFPEQTPLQISHANEST